MLIITGNSSHHPPPKKPKTAYFNRAELSHILNSYSSKVATCEWRDYALDHINGAAIFSIYRSSHETPLYTIEKKRLKGKDRWMFILRDRQKILRQTARLHDLLDYLDNSPRLVNN
jgi:hypothetical protein